jgi:HEAT repeat protein/thiol-disulfide isomerase/thioredoxin
MMNRLRQLKRFRTCLPLLLAGWVVGMTGPESGLVAPIFHSSFKSASDAAAADQSLVLLVFSAEWCGPCKLLKSQTLDAPEFLALDAPLHVADVDIDANQKMARDFEVEAVPTLVLVTPDGKIIERQTGFMKVAELLAWLKTGRTRAAAGQWEGTVPGAQFNELIKKASGADLGTNEIHQLVDYLGDADPANRDQAAKLLLEQREKAVPLLIEAVGNPYLGERIGAGDLLQHLAPNLPPIEPWQSPATMSNVVAELRQWWAANGKLPLPTAPATNSFSANSVKEAIDALRGDDPARRTAAMTTLVQAGAGALPAVRDALKRAERNGDQRALGLLEDVRWTIVVPDAVEEQSGGVRNVLARGKSTERQAAATRLGGMGRNALNVLVELAGDTDPLVVENAIHALAGISGDDAIPALATLLSAGDSNLRMTAAQALGQTKNPAAIKPLLPAFKDPDEVVACAALSALEENLARDSYSPTTVALAPGTIDALKHGLQDPRWRVRAAAAEAAGKLSAAKLKDDLNKLLSDSDGFVVKSALTALETLNSQPDSDQILALAKRLPSLQGDAVEALLRTESEETVNTVTKLFNDGNTDTRVAILGAFLHRGFYGYTQNDEGWKPMLAQAIGAPDAHLRQTAARVLSRRTPIVQAQLVGPLLTDEDPETRRIGASLVLQILGKSKSSRNQMVFTGSMGNTSATSTTNKSVASPAQIAEWHQALLQRSGTNLDLNLAAALFVTGDGQKERPILLAALNNHPETNATEAETGEEDDLSAIQAIMPKLSLPDDQPVLEKFTASPLAFAQAVRQAKLCKPEVVDFLLAPARFKTAVEPAAGKELSAALNLVAGYDYEYDANRGWSLWSESDQAKAVVDALLTSTNAGWRAAAVFALGFRANAKDHLEVLAKAAADPDPWVRGSAARALARAIKTRPELEKSLAPLLAETNLTVAAAAAVALLEPETRAAADLDSTLDYFEYDSVRGGRSVTRNSNDDRPLATVDGKPTFLADVQKRLAAAGGDESSVFALLLAQYGDFSGVDLLVAHAATRASPVDETVSAALTGIALSHDVKYLPALKRMTAAERGESSLRKILQAMKGMSGSEARQLRLEVNKKIRNAASPSALSD